MAAPSHLCRAGSSYLVSHAMLTGQLYCPQIDWSIYDDWNKSFYREYACRSLMLDPTQQLTKRCDCLLMVNVETLYVDGSRASVRACPETTPVSCPAFAWKGVPVRSVALSYKK